MELWIGEEEIGLGGEICKTTMQFDVPIHEYNATCYINGCRRTQSEGEWHNNHVSKRVCQDSIYVRYEAEICIA